MHKPLFVAGTFHEAAYWAEQLGFTRREWVYLDSRSVHGHLDPTVYVVGRYWLHPDLNQIWDMLVPTNATVIFAEEMAPRG